MNTAEEAGTGTTEEYLPICLNTRIVYVCQTLNLNSLDIAGQQLLFGKIKIIIVLLHSKTSLLGSKGKIIYRLVVRLQKLVNKQCNAQHVLQYGNTRMISFSANVTSVSKL